MDAGGLYRDLFSQVGEDVCGAHFALCVRTANADMDITYVPNAALLLGSADAEGGGGGAQAGASSAGLTIPGNSTIPSVTMGTTTQPETQAARALAFWECLGRLAGLAIRTKGCLPLSFAPLVWKRLLGEATTLSDLAHVNGAEASRLKAIRAGRKPHDKDHDDAWHVLRSEADFAVAYPGLRFTMVDAAGSLVELIPQGADVPVTLSNRAAYCDAAESYQLAAYDDAIAAMRRGLGNVVPFRVLANLFTAREVERMVCGDPSIDVETLRRHTKYASPFSETHPQIQRFWRVFSTWAPVDRSRYCRFIYGRSRLPLKDEDWQHAHHIAPLNATTSATGRRLKPFPIGHACFQKLELGLWMQTDEELHDALLTSIHISEQQGFSLQ